MDESVAPDDGEATEWGVVEFAEPLADGRPTLFCWCEMVLGGQEEALVRAAFKAGAGLFACDQYAIFSSKKRSLGVAKRGTSSWKVVTWVNPAPKAVAGEYGVNGTTTNSFLNTQTFIQAWDILIGSGVLWDYDWVVKVDPDAVFLASRLTARLDKYRDVPVYFANCGNQFWTGLYGSVEVFSKLAMKAYADNLGTCKSLPWRGWGEDYYMEKCMQALGVWQVLDASLVGDKYCAFTDDSACNDTSKVAFHPFKTPEAYLKCLRTSQQADRAVVSANIALADAAAVHGI